MPTPIIDALMDRAQRRPVIQQQVQRSPLIAQALLAQGMSGEPVDSFWESAGKLAQTWAGNRLQGQEVAAAEAKQREQSDELAEIMAGMNLDPAQAQLIAQLPPDQQIEALLPLFAGTEPQEPTDDIQEYEYARQNGFQGTFEEWQMLRPPTTQITNNLGPTGIDYGPPTEGYVYARDEAGAVKLDERGAPVEVPRGPEFAEQQAAEQQAAQAQSAYVSDATNVLRTIDDALGLAEGGNVGFWGGLLGNLPFGTPQYELGQLLGTVRTNVGIQEIQTMRENSPTGGAVGQVTVAEWERFERAIQSLMQPLPEDRLRQNLYEVKAAYLDAVHGTGNWSYADDGTVLLHLPDGTLQPWSYQRPEGQIPPEYRQQPQIEVDPGSNLPAPDAEGWIDLGNGVRIRPMQ